MPSELSIEDANKESGLSNDTCQTSTSTPTSSQLFNQQPHPQSSFGNTAASNSDFQMQTGSKSANNMQTSLKIENDFNNNSNQSYQNANYAGFMDSSSYLYGNTNASSYSIHPAAHQQPYAYHPQASSQSYGNNIQSPFFPNASLGSNLHGSPASLHPYYNSHQTHHQLNDFADDQSILHQTHNNLVKSEYKNHHHRTSDLDSASSTRHHDQSAQHTLTLLGNTGSNHQLVSNQFNHDTNSETGKLLANE
jgi:hypothetical protein